jgi:hypothetical protein
MHSMFPRFPRVVAVPAAAVIFLLAPQRAAAEGTARVVVADFDGTGASRVRSAVVEGLDQGGVALVPHGEATTAATELGVDLDGSDGRAQVGRSLGVSGFVEGDVASRGSGRGRRWRARVRLVDSQTGETRAEASYIARTPPRLLTKVRRGVMDELGDAIAQLSPLEVETADEEEPEPEAATESDEGSAAATAGATAGGETSAGETVRATASPVDVSAGLQLYSRSFEYNDDLFGALRPYALNLGPELGARLRWYPGAHFTDGVAAHIGVEVQGARSFAISSASQGNDSSFPTHSRRYGAGLRGRIPLGDHQLAVAAGWHRHVFRIDASSPAGPLGGETNQPGVPSVDYRFIRLGADARFALGAGVTTFFGAAFRVMTGLGELATDAWFPRADGRGMDAHAGFGYELVDSLEVRLAFEMSRYWFTMNPEPGDTNVAGGAVDQYLGGSLNLAWRPD